MWTQVEQLASCVSLHVFTHGLGGTCVVLMRKWQTRVQLFSTIVCDMAQLAWLGVAS